MKMRIQHLLFALLITLVAVPAYAATYDATGRWRIDTNPGQTIFGITIPDAWLWATIDQPGGSDSFMMETDEIVDFGNISYSGAGVVNGAQYTFTPTLTEIFDLADLPDYPGATFDVIISLAGFDLIAANKLSGAFEIETLAGGSIGTVAFTGTKAVVPLPAAVWLLGTGMVALFGIRRRSAEG
jgi:hypothetical protein